MARDEAIDSTQGPTSGTGPTSRCTRSDGESDLSGNRRGVQPRRWNYKGDDARPPAAVRDFNGANHIRLPSSPHWRCRHATWAGVALCATDGEAPECESLFVAPRAHRSHGRGSETLALHRAAWPKTTRRAAARRGARRAHRLARDIHDTLAQGFAAILMQLQAAQRAAGALPPSAARSLETRSVLPARTWSRRAGPSSALRPDTGDAEDLGAVAAARDRSCAPHQRCACRVDNRGAARLWRRRPTRNHRHRAGGADQRGQALARRRIAVHASGVRGVGFRLSVAGDGRGIARERQSLGFGLTSMHGARRAFGASLTIVTAPRSGTEVVLAWEPPSFSIPGHADAGG